MTQSKSSAAARASFEVIAESIPHLVWLADASGCTDYLNERGTEYTGLPRQANYGWRWVELVHPDDAVRARLGWEHATRTATPFELPFRILRADGVFRWHAFRALPVRGRQGEILRWIGTADDIDGSPVTESLRSADGPLLRPRPRSPPVWPLGNGRWSGWSPPATPMPRSPAFWGCPSEASRRAVRGSAKPWGCAPGRASFGSRTMRAWWSRAAERHGTGQLFLHVHCGNPAAPRLMPPGGRRDVTVSNGIQFLH